MEDALSGKIILITEGPLPPRGDMAGIYDLPLSGKENKQC